MKDLLTPAIIELLTTQRFYASLIMQMNRVFSNRVPTAGVNVTNKINLYINPEFWKKLTLKEQVAVLVHEIFHVINDHITRGKQLENGEYNKIMNIAADLAINEFIPNLPKGACYVDDFKAELPFLENKQTMEYYYKAIMENKDAFSGAETSDDHSLWEECEEGDQSEGGKEYKKALLKDFVKKALEEAKNGSGAGYIPNEIRGMLDGLFYVPKNWKNDLNKFVAKQTEVVVESSRKVRNRRYGIVFPGYKKYPTLKLAVAIDTSGSMSSEQINQIFSEVRKLHDTGVEVHVIEADCVIGKVYEYDPKKKVEVSGGGGTAYQPAINEACKLEVDGLIYFGDGDSADTPTKPRFPVLWAMNEGCKPPVEWGYKTEVVIKQGTK